MTDVIQLELPFQETAITGYVYTLTFPGGYVYVGSTTQEVKYRISDHISDIRHGRGCKNLAIAANHFGLHQVRCQDTNRLRWQFNQASISSKRHKVSNVKQLRKLERQTIRRIDYHLRLNERLPMLNSNTPNDFSIPVSCQAWIDMLYPEQSEQRVDAAA